MQSHDEMTVPTLCQQTIDMISRYLELALRHVKEAAEQVSSATAHEREAYKLRFIDIIDSNP